MSARHRSRLDPHSETLPSHGLSLVKLNGEFMARHERVSGGRAAPRRGRRRRGLAGEAAERGDVHTCTSGHSRVGSRLLKAAR